MSVHFPRPALAEAYLRKLQEGEEPIALFSPRRTGKTQFLRKDLLPLAEREGLLVVYADVWQDKTDPAQALIYALRRALDAINLPGSTLGKRLRTPIKKLGALGASIEFGNEPEVALPDSKYLLLDALLRKLVHDGGKKLLLMIDEVQQLALAADGEQIVAALRSSLTQNHGQIHAVLTGSSRDQLNELFSRAKAPMYEFASVIKFPLLGRDFVEFAAGRFARLTGCQLDIDQLLAAFETLEQRPKMLERLLDNMESEHSFDLDLMLARLQSEREIEQDFSGQWYSLTALQQTILLRIALAQDLYTKEALAAYSQRLGTTVNPGSVKHAVEQLRKKTLIIKLGERFEFESKAFMAFVRASAATPEG